MTGSTLIAPSSITARNLDPPALVERKPELIRQARISLRTTQLGMLASLDPAGHPFASCVGVATDCDGSPIILTSSLAPHTRNMEKDGRVSLFLPPLLKEQGHLTVSGHAVKTSEPRVRRRYLNRHRKATSYADRPDMSFWQIGITAGHFLLRLDAADILVSLAGAESLVEAEASTLRNLNADRYDLIRLLANKLGGDRDGPWRCAGLDPEGLDLRWGKSCLRVLFPRRVHTPAELTRVLDEMAAAQV
jgi:putative heme iron utilization protein